VAEAGSYNPRYCRSAHRTATGPAFGSTTLGSVLGSPCRELNFPLLFFPSFPCGAKRLFFFLSFVKFCKVLIEITERNRVSLQHLCLPTGPYIETRFLYPYARPQETERNRVSLQNLCLPTGPYIETRFLYPYARPQVSQETGFL
jgi:hypothetical protein